MKNIKAIAATVLLGTLSLGAQAGWYCEAQSYSGSGWGSAFYRSQAANLALGYCAANTPYNQTCYITGCNVTRGAGDDKGGEVSGQDSADRKSLIESIDTKSFTKEEMKQGEKK